MMRSFLTVALVLCLVLVSYPNPFAQEVVIPVTVKHGPVMQEGADGAMATAVGFQAPMYAVPYVGEIIKQPEITFFMSEREHDGETELNMFRLSSTRQYSLGRGFYLGPSGGYWHLINSEGKDDDFFAYGFEVGWRRVVAGQGVEVYLGCDVVAVYGPNLYWPHLSISFFSLPQ
jgi:hypothetical protein